LQGLACLPVGVAEFGLGRVADARQGGHPGLDSLLHGAAKEEVGIIRLPPAAQEIFCGEGVGRINPALDFVDKELFRRRHGVSPV